MLGSGLVCLFLAKIVGDTVKYYDHCGFKGKERTGVLIAGGLTLAL
jgi:hypothetical protein